MPPRRWTSSPRHYYIYAKTTPARLLTSSDRLHTTPRIGTGPSARTSISRRLGSSSVRPISSKTKSRGGGASRSWTASGSGTTCPKRGEHLLPPHGRRSPWVGFEGAEPAALVFSGGWKNLPSATIRQALKNLTIVPPSGRGQEDADSFNSHRSTGAFFTWSTQAYRSRGPCFRALSQSGRTIGFPTGSCTWRHHSPRSRAPSRLKTASLSARAISRSAGVHLPGHDGAPVSLRFQRGDRPEGARWYKRVKRGTLPVQEVSNQGEEQRLATLLFLGLCRAERVVDRGERAERSR